MCETYLKCNILKTRIHTRCSSAQDEVVKPSLLLSCSFVNTDFYCVSANNYVCRCDHAILFQCCFMSTETVGTIKDGSSGLTL